MSAERKKIITLQDFVDFITEKNIKCVMCNAKLPKVVHFYPHKDGLIDLESNKRVWAYIVCDKCGYQNSFVKLLNKIRW